MPALPGEYICAAAVVIIFLGGCCLVFRRDAVRTALGVMIMGNGAALLLALSGYREGVPGTVLAGPERAACVVLIAAFSIVVLLCAFAVGALGRRGVDVTDSRRLKG